MARTITVAPGPNLQPSEVAIWEVDARHPNGEIFLSQGDEPIEVARTNAVSTRLGDGRLIEAEARPKPVLATETSPAPSQSHTGGHEVIPGVTEGQRDALVAAGFVTTADIRNATDDQLLAVDGIGPQTVQRLREAVKE